MNRIKQIEDEYGEPFEDVVKGFVEMGYSSPDIGRLLGWSSESGLWYWMRKLGIKIDWPGQKGKHARLKAATLSHKRVEALHSLHEKTRQRYGFWHDGVFDTLRGHAIRKGVKVQTAEMRRYKHRDRGPDYWLSPARRPTPPQLRSRYEKDYFYSNRNHAWRKNYGRSSRQSAQG